MGRKVFVLEPRTTSAISSNGSCLSFLWASLRGQVGFFIPFLPWPSKSFQCHTKAVIIKAQFPSFSPWVWSEFITMPETYSLMSLNPWGSSFSLKALYQSTSDASSSLLAQKHSSRGLFTTVATCPSYRPFRSGACVALCRFITQTSRRVRGC